VTDQTDRYRHRTAEVEAVQWTGSNADTLSAFCSPFNFQTIDPEDRIEDPDQTAAVRESEHGTWRGLAPGDWVVKHGGDYFECSAADFAKLYEPAGQAPATDRAALRERIAEALMRWAEGNNSPQYAPIRRPETVRENAYSRADAVLSVLPASVDQAASVCICGHSGQQHFEDVCITEITGCDCGDYLEPEAAREVIARWRTAALQARVDRATVLREAAAMLDQRATGIDAFASSDHGEEARAVRELADAANELRRMAAAPSAVVVRRAADETPGEARPRCPHCQMPHDPTPSMNLTCASIRASIRDRDAAEAQQPAPRHVGGNAEDCPACRGTNPDYPFICPGPDADETQQPNEETRP
jgi:hypothetical protein